MIATDKHDADTGGPRITRTGTIGEREDCFLAALGHTSAA